METLGSSIEDNWALTVVSVGRTDLQAEVQHGRWLSGLLTGIYFKSVKSMKFAWILYYGFWMQYRKVVLFCCGLVVRISGYIRRSGSIPGAIFSEK
jgi:hypothetical protein